MKCINDCPSSEGTRPSKVIANACIAWPHCGIGIVHFFAIFRKAQDSSLKAPSSLGNEPLVSMTFRKLIFNDAIAFVV